MLPESDIPTILIAASQRGMAPEHGFFILDPSPYHSRAHLNLWGLDTGELGHEILNSVFVITLEFLKNVTSADSTTSAASERRRRSVEDYDVNLPDMTSRESDDVANEDDVDRVGWSSKDVRTELGEYVFRFSEEKIIDDVQDKNSGSEESVNAILVDEKVVIDIAENLPEQQEQQHSQHLQQQQQQQQQQQHNQQSHTKNTSRTLSSNHILVQRRLKRSTAGTTSSQNTTDISDLDALGDVILALGYMLDNSSHSSSSSPITTLPVPSALFSLFRSLDFEGNLGRIVVLNESQNRQYDARVYDFDGSGKFVERLYFSSVSPDTWTVTQSGSFVWPNGQVLGADDCFMDDNCEQSGFDVIYVLIIFASIVGIGTILTIGVLFVRRYWAKKEMTRGPNKVILSPDDLVFMLKKDIGKGSKILKSRTNLMEQSRPDLLRGSDPNRSTGSINELSDFTQTARYNGDLVHVKELKVKNVDMKTKTFSFLRMLRDLRHENVNPFVGLLMDPDRPAMVVEYCSRGSLKDMLHNEDIKLDWDFKLSLLNDLVRGMRYLHNTPLKTHGHLTSRNCVIDSRFVLKITDYGISAFSEKMKTSRDLEARDLLWTAPELLRDDLLLRRGTDKGDVYSMSIIFQEVALRSEPYSSHTLTPEEIIKKVRKPPPLCRPSVSPQAAPPQFIQTMKQCWSEMPDMRPTVEEVYEQFKKLTGGKKANIVDTMFKMLEKYSNDLEDIVTERTLQLEEEKKKTDQLLFRMLPSMVAESLKMGRNVQAETFSEVTIYFSDIVGFTTISALSTPMQVVDLLNDLYTMFDATIERYDVYKVETIGDAYMVVSGLPVRNGNRHAGEIGTMALDLLSQCGHFTIKHMPEVPLRLRIGLHSGSVVAGVVGLTMPRYCLFGDTVNTASRMESTGAAFRIHVSQVCKEMLDVLGGYELDYRGKTELKGKGIHETWWLTGKQGATFDLPEPPPLTGLSSILPNPNLPCPAATADNPETPLLDLNLTRRPKTPQNGDPALPDECPKPAKEEDEGGNPEIPPRPGGGDAGFDSGKGESSDGDSPQSPKAPSSKSPIPQPPPPSSMRERKPAEDTTKKTSPKPNSNGGKTSTKSTGGTSNRSPHKGGHARSKAVSFSTSEKPAGSKPKSSLIVKHSVTTEAEIYPQSSKSDPDLTSDELARLESQQDSLQQFISGSSPAHLDTVDEVGGGETMPAKAKLERKETNDSGVDVKARNSVVSASEVSLHSNSSATLTDKRRQLMLEGRDADLSPVTEV